MDREDGNRVGTDQGVPKISEPFTRTETGTGAKAGTKSGSKPGSSSSASAKAGASETGSNTGAEKIEAAAVLGLPVISEIKGKGKKTKSNSSDNKKLKDSISMMLTVGFGLAASRLGDHWIITPEEADTVAEPAVRVLDQLGASELMGKYGDYAALLLAAGIIVVPRLMITKAIIENQGGGKKIERKEKKVAGNPAENPQRSRTPNAGSLKADLISMDQQG
jgi:hypothetical protein